MREWVVSVIYAAVAVIMVNLCGPLTVAQGACIGGVVGLSWSIGQIFAKENK